MFNKSSIVLTQDQEDLLNRGLNFAVLPNRLDLTQILTDFRYFERTIVWIDFWFGRDQDGQLGKRIFKKKKTNFPKNYKMPNHLKTFLGSVKSELTDPENRNPAKCNLPLPQLSALKELINLQKEKKIIIKRCDKGAGIIILDYDDCIKACETHLNSKQVLDDGIETPYYLEVKPDDLEKTKTKNKFHTSRSIG